MVLLFSLCKTRQHTKRKRVGFCQRTESGPQKVCADCPGYLLWITLVNTKVIQFWKFLYFNSSERCCKLLPSCFSLCSTAFPAIHKQDSRSYFPIVCIAIIKASYFLMFAQTFLEEI